MKEKRTSERSNVLAGDRRLIRSLGDGVRVVNMERMFAVLRRERMVAHDLANTSFGISESAFRGSFFS